MTTAPARRGSLLERAGAAAYLTGWRVVRLLPEPVVSRVFRRIADGMWARRGRGVVQLERNLARVLDSEPGHPAVRELSRAAMRSYLRYWSEAFRLPSWPPQQVLARIEVEGEERLRAELALGVGVVLALPHCANWDHAGAWLSGAGMPFTTVAERLKPEALFDAFVDYRTRLGMEVLALGDGSGGEVFLALAARLREGRLVCLVADRDLSASGVDVTFFGLPARMPPGPAALSVSTGAGLIPVTLWYGPDRLHLRIHPKIEQPTQGPRSARVAAMTQELAGIFETAIRENPADWHMLQRLWLDDLRLRHPAAPGPRAARGRS